MTVPGRCDDYYTLVISPGQEARELPSHPSGTVQHMDRHLLPGAFADAFLLSLTLLFLYVTVLAAASFSAA